MVILQKNRGLCSYLEVSDIQNGNSYEINMLLNNRIYSVPMMKVQEIDNQVIFSYKIDGLMVLSKYYGRKQPGIAELKDLMEGIRCSMEEIRPYLLSAGNLVLDVNYILYNPNERRYQFIYVPGYKKDFLVQMKELLEDIMVIFDHQDKEGVTFLYEVYSRFLEDNFSPELFCKYISEMHCSDNMRIEIKTEQGEGIKKNLTMNEICFENNTEQEMTVSDFADGNKSVLCDKKKRIFEGTVRSGIIISISVILCIGGYFVLGKNSYKLIAGVVFGCVLILAIMGAHNREADHIEKDMREAQSDSTAEKVMLCQAEGAFSDTPNLMQKRSVERLVPYMDRTREPILLSEGCMKIGRIMNVVDYCLDAPGISRVHAEIEKQAGHVTLMDVGSTNGTYVNHIRLVQNQKKEIKYGDIVSFAGEEYYCL